MENETLPLKHGSTETSSGGDGMGAGSLLWLNMFPLRQAQVGLGWPVLALSNWVAECGNLVENGTLPLKHRSTETGSGGARVACLGIE